MKLTIKVLDRNTYQVLFSQILFIVHNHVQPEIAALGTDHVTATVKLAIPSDEKAVLVEGTQELDRISIPLHVAALGATLRCAAIRGATQTGR